jgi:hypothetical protein
VWNFKANNYLNFIDEEILSEGTSDTKALHISLKCKDFIMACVLIDNGSSLNIIPKSTLMKLIVDISYMNPNNMIMKTFEGTGGIYR